VTITSIRLRNFKRFLQAELPMKPLTVLTGLNGGGKTSILHALLLARQASSGSPPPDFVQLNGPFGLELGEVQDVLHLDADPDDGISVEVDDGAGTSHNWRFRTSDERSLNLRVLDRPRTPPAALAGEASRFSYLSAERLGPRDTLGASSVASDDLQVGHRGEFTAQVLAVLDRLRVSAKRLNPKTHALGGATTLRQQVEWWLSDIARPIALDAEWVPGSGVTLIRYRTPGHPVERRRPTNMGFGVTYALPVITAALMAPRDSLLLVENPEAHLHPSGQSAIGAFLSMIASDGVQVIVETHSDHVINGIRRAIAADRTLAPEEATIQFFESDRSDMPGIRTIDIRARGDLSDWPPGFFDQMDTDLAVLAKVRRSGK
jgi:predicted ATPase